MLKVYNLQFVLVELGKPDKEAKTRSAPCHSNFSLNQKRQDIDVRLCEKGVFPIVFSRN